jgi:hypothetical protein
VRVEIPKPDGVVLWTLGPYVPFLDQQISKQNQQINMLRSIGYL